MIAAFVLAYLTTVIAQLLTLSHSLKGTSFYQLIVSNKDTTRVFITKLTMSNIQVNILEFVFLTLCGLTVIEIVRLFLRSSGVGEKVSSKEKTIKCLNLFIKQTVDLNSLIARIAQLIFVLTIVFHNKIIGEIIPLNNEPIQLLYVPSEVRTFAVHLWLKAVTIGIILTLFQIKVLQREQ